MKNRLIKGAVVIAFLAFLIGAFFVPRYEALGVIGKYLLEDAVVFSSPWTETEKLVEVLLGEQSYWESPEQYVDYQEILVQNENSACWISEDDEIEHETSLQTIAAPTPVPTGDTRKTTASGQSGQVEKLKKTGSVDYLLGNFFIVDSSTSVVKKELDVRKMLEENFTLPKQAAKKQILIYHTHGASEAFADSGKNDTDSVVGVGDALTTALEKKGYGVIHDRTKYDVANGKMDRSLAYNEAYKSISRTLQDNPSIEVVIDLHRDSIQKGKHTSVEINGKQCAVVMFFNGMSRSKTGPIAYLANPNRNSNLAFSLQLKCKAMECYPGFTKPIYLKGYRYNLHMKKRSLLIELGNQNNTVQEAKNATEPLADVIDKVLTGK